MFTSKRIFAVAMGLFALTGCAHRQLSADSLSDVRRLAVVVRAIPGPRVAVATADAREHRVYPTLSPSEADKQLQEVLAKQVTVFELEERIRAELLKRMPAVPPWTTSMPPADVATALQSLLVVDRTTPLDLKALRAAGADAVLELRVTGWGVAVKSKAGLYLQGQGRLYSLPSESGIWSDSLDTDLAVDPEVEAVDAVALKNGGFREAIKVLVDRLVARIGPELSGAP
ncbi:MAG: hypothetical protein HY901_19475 [Deltaproteobacteria bacterium]|nr:hypothetical protein [Deltaproteobacteria bacterium]